MFTSMQKKISQPIGVFDSGIGGLTLLKRLMTLLPNENIIYFGDTAHLPYGDKSREAICSYTQSICEYLKEQGCKAILIACNSASAAAYEQLKDKFDHEMPIINVIDPVVHHIVTHDQYRSIGLIGTKQTVESKSYENKLREQAERELAVYPVATPLLAPMIEKGFCHGKIVNEVIETYLNHFDSIKLDALLLACTHYPIIKKEIGDYFKQKVEIIDTLDIVSNAVRDRLAAENLLNDKPRTQFELTLSDDSETFEQSAKIFFGENLTFKSL